MFVVLLLIIVVSITLLGFVNVSLAGLPWKGGLVVLVSF